MTDKMKNVWKHIINVTFAAVLVCVLTAAFCLGVSSRKGIRCKGVTITVTDSATNQFITPKEIRKFLDEEYTGYIGEPIDSIDLTRIEKILDSKSAILKSQAFTTKDSLLNIIVTQRKPVVRFQKGQGGFYADAEGHLFPLQNTYASHVLIVDGRIPLKLEYGYTGKLEMAQGHGHHGEPYRSKQDLEGQDRTDYGRRRRRSDADSARGQGKVPVRTAG